MKSTIRKAGLSLLLSLFVSGAVLAQTNNLYVFNTDGTKQTFLLSEIQELTFTNAELIINKTVGDPVPVAFTVLNYFSLKDDGGVSIPTVVKATETVSVFSLDNVAVVKSTQTITRISVFNLQGKQLIRLYPASEEVNVSLASYPSGIYLIQVANENGITTKKIIKN
jgi:hypothetical protein